MACYGLKVGLPIAILLARDEIAIGTVVSKCLPLCWQEVCENEIDCQDPVKRKMKDSRWIHKNGTALVISTVRKPVPSILDMIEWVRLVRFSVTEDMPVAVPCKNQHLLSNPSLNCDVYCQPFD